MKRETETELGFRFRSFLMAGNVHHHGNLGEPEHFFKFSLHLIDHALRMNLNFHLVLFFLRMLQYMNEICSLDLQEATSNFQYNFSFSFFSFQDPKREAKHGQVFCLASRHINGPVELLTIWCSHWTHKLSVLNT